MTVTNPCVYGCADPSRLYACGWRCAEHTPARLAGSPEPPDLSHVRPWWIREDGTELSASPTSTAIDRQVTQSGRRVAGWRRRAARAEVSE